MDLVVGEVYEIEVVEVRLELAGDQGGVLGPFTVSERWSRNNWSEGDRDNRKWFV